MSMFANAELNLEVRHPSKIEQGCSWAGPAVPPTKMGDGGDLARKKSATFPYEAQRRNKVSLKQSRANERLETIGKR
jgi:hypothetical protein